jgi:CDP-diacylglycerol--glycerol-3-phosphate 3-phosphatidyltransferase
MAGVTIYALKPRFQALLRPVVGRLAALGIAANQVTLAALLGSLAVGIAVLWSSEHRRLFLLLAAWLFLRLTLNAADGMLGWRASYRWQRATPRVQLIESDIKA